MPSVPSASSSPVIGDDDAAGGRGGGDEVDGGGDEGGHAGLHVGGAAAVEPAALDDGAEGVVAPGGRVAGRHHVGVAVEAEDRAGGAPAGEEVGDAVAVGAGGAEAGGGEHAVEELDRAALLRRHRGAADSAAVRATGSVMARPPRPPIAAAVWRGNSSARGCGAARRAAPQRARRCGRLCHARADGAGARSSCA